MTVQAYFENRSARMIALLRAVLAFVFLVALLVEPASAGKEGTQSQMLLAVYFLASLGLMVLAWRSWWRDHRLAPAMLVVDTLVFTVAIYLIESWDVDFNSPFLGAFAFVMLSATLRWDWRVAARAGIGATLLFVGTGLAMIAADLPIDVYRYARRIAYMLVLLLVLVWFGVQRREPRVPAVDLPPDYGGDDEALLWQVIAYARKLSGAAFGLVAWSPAEEPWVEVRSDGPAGRQARRVGPEELGQWGARRTGALLFDAVRGGSLVLDEDGRPRARKLAAAVPLAERAGVSEGLLLRFRAASGDGLILLGGIVGSGPDHLRLGKAIAREVGNAFDRIALSRLEREALLDLTRSAIARDLHDSVAQSLAGACFRLEALRRTLTGALGEAASGPVQEVLSVRDALRREQGHVRGLIASLRQPAPEPTHRDLRADLEQTLADAGAHWALVTTLDAPEAAEVPGWLSHELQQTVREAVANAARHGNAGQVRVNMALAGGRLALQIHDDGAGFGVAAAGDRPWSISERVAALGGELTVQSQPGGTRLEIVLTVSASAAAPMSLRG